MLTNFLRERNGYGWQHTASAVRFEIPKSSVQELSKQIQCGKSSRVALNKILSLFVAGSFLSKEKRF